MIRINDETLKKHAPTPASENLVDVKVAAAEFLIYLKSLKAQKQLRATVAEMVTLCNTIYNLNYTERSYLRFCDDVLSEAPEEDFSKFNDKLLELKKERVKLSDERVQNNAYIRRLAREDTLKEIALEAARIIGESKALLTPDTSLQCTPTDDHKEAILMLSDWHYGIECKNHWNTYSPEIAKKRLINLKAQVIEHLQSNHIEKLHVLNLADLIAGRIHLTLRLESRLDVITQVMEVTELLAEFLVDLSQYAPVDYYSCLDNHSRIEPNKADSLDLESFCRITDWYLKERLQPYNIEIHENTFGDDIITFKCKGYSVLGVHGDKDKPTQIIDSISRMTQEHFDLICTAHLHHFSCDEKNNTVVVCNGALLGTDTYAKNLRLSSQPSQNLIIVSNRSVCETIYRILV